MGRPPRRVLLLKECCLGDVLMVTPVIRAVRRAFPACEIVFGVGPWARVMVENNPHLDRMIEYPRIWNPRNDWSLRRRLAYVWRLRRERFDLIICMEMGSRIASICRMIGAPVRGGFNWRGEGLFHNVRLRRWPNDRSGVSANLALLRLLGIPEAGRAMEFFPTAGAVNRATDVLHAAGVTPDVQVVAIAPGGGANPGTSMPTKRWPADKYRALAARLAVRPGIRVVILGGPDDHDVAGAVCAQTDVVNLTGRLSLDATGALLARCALFVGNDSGPLHLAIAMGVPTVSVFGPTNPAMYVSADPRHTALWAELPCSPCHKTMLVTVHRCTNDHFMECMDLISVDQVYQACEHALTSGLTPADRAKSAQSWPMS